MNGAAQAWRVDLRLAPYLSQLASGTSAPLN